MAFINDNPPPATVVLISGDRDFAYLLSTVRWRKHNVVLISNSSMTHESLIAQASVTYDWKSDILKAQPPPKPPLFRYQTLLSFATPIIPRKSENLSNAHPICLPNGCVSPVTQCLTLPPRPASATTVDTTPPRRASLLSNPPFVESEVVPMPPKAGTPTEAAPDSIPPNLTPDDWIEAGLVGGSVTVNVHITVIHPILIGSCLTRNN